MKILQQYLQCTKLRNLQLYWPWCLDTNAGAAHVKDKAKVAALCEARHFRMLQNKILLLHWKNDANLICKHTVLQLTILCTVPKSHVPGVTAAVTQWATSTATLYKNNVSFTALALSSMLQRIQQKCTRMWNVKGKVYNYNQKEIWDRAARSSQTKAPAGRELKPGPTPHNVNRMLYQSGQQ